MFDHALDLSDLRGGVIISGIQLQFDILLLRIPRGGGGEANHIIVFHPVESQADTQVFLLFPGFRRRVRQSHAAAASEEKQKKNRAAINSVSHE